MAGIAAPEASRSIENAIAVDIGIVHALSGSEEAGRRLELAVRRERHPEIIEHRRVRLADLIHLALLWLSERPPAFSSIEQVLFFVSVTY